MANVPLRHRDVKFYGLQIAVRYEETIPVGYIDWEDLWTNWDFTYISDQIDWAKDIGFNMIVMLGDTRYASQGRMTLTTYLSRRRQVVEYCAAKNMYFLPYLSAYFANSEPSTDEQMAESMAADAAMMSTFDNVPGVVLLDEPWHSAQPEYGPLQTAEAVHTRMLIYYDAVKAVVPPNFAVGTVNPSGDYVTTELFSTAAGIHTDWPAASDTFGDFWVFHLFFNAVPADWAAIRARYPNKEFIFLSCGGHMGMSSAAQTLRIQKIMDCMNASDSRGGAIWCGRDFYTSASGDSARNGIFDDDGTPRVAQTVPATAGVLKTHPARAQRYFPGNPRLNNKTIWQEL